MIKMLYEVYRCFTSTAAASHHSCFYWTGLVKTESSLVRSVETGLGRWMLMVAVISVHAYPFCLAFSAETWPVTLLVVTGIAMFIISPVNRLLTLVYRGQRVKGLLSCIIHVRNNFKVKAIYTFSGPSYTFQRIYVWGSIPKSKAAHFLF